MMRVGLLFTLLIVIVPACKREERAITDDERRIAARAASEPNGAYHNNAWAIGQGSRLYSQMNCIGCHAHGGGGMGPPLKDGGWRYGADGRAIFVSIMDGRPNGMPAFRSRLTNQQAWQLVAYVRSLSGHEASSARSSRDDHMTTGEPINRRETLSIGHEPVPSP